MPQIREKSPRTRNASVSLKLVLSESEVERLRADHPDGTLTHAMTVQAMALINQYFTTKRAK
jgi:hypothetical protein